MLGIGRSIVMIRAYFLSVCRTGNLTVIDSAYFLNKPPLSV